MNFDSGNLKFDSEFSNLDFSAENLIKGLGNLNSGPCNLFLVMLR